jgi:hypothetical protein
MSGMAADKAEGRYALRGGEDAKRRLDLIAGVLQPTTATLLDQLGITEGQPLPGRRLRRRARRRRARP